MCFKYFKRFKEGAVDVPSHKQPVTTSKKIKLMVMGKYLCIGITFGSSQTIFTGVLGMKRMTAKFVPKCFPRQLTSHGLFLNFWPKITSLLSLTALKKVKEKTVNRQLSGITEEIKTE